MGNMEHRKMKILILGKKEKCLFTSGEKENRSPPPGILLVNLCSKLYLPFILQWIAFIFGRDEEGNQ